MRIVSNLFSSYRLSRGAEKKNLPRLMKKARSEQLLLQTYVKAPTPTDETQSTNVDVVSAHILGMLDPTKLHEYSPRNVAGDGNCMYRAISLGIFNTEDHHLYLRLATAIEIIFHRQSYDVQAREYSGELRDPCIIVSEYWALLSLACTQGDFSEMMHIYACSAILGKAFQSYYPLHSSLTSSFTRYITGRGVTRDTGPDVTCLMWTQSTQLADCTSFFPNHFCLLVRQKNNANVAHGTPVY